MSYTFKQVLLPSSKYDIKSPFKMEPKYITVHNTANDASAANEISYHNSNNNQVSYHVAVDDKEIIQCIPFDRNAWHCGDGGGVNSGNRTSIGIEICYSKSGGERYKQAEENAVQYIAKLLKQFGWGIDRVKKHQDWSNKYCPHRILSENRWNSFLKRVEQAMKMDKKEEVAFVFSSPTLKVTVENLLKDKKAQKEFIQKGIAAKAFNQSWMDKFNNGQLAEHDIIGLHVIYAQAK